MVKRVKICKKVSFRVENLKIEVILIFFESFLGITRCHFSRVHVLLYHFCFNLCLYLVLLVFLGLFDQTSATKSETCVCFLFFIRYYEFWKRFHGYHSNNRIYTWYVLESDLLCFEKIYTSCDLLSGFMTYRSMKGSVISWRLENLNIFTNYFLRLNFE